MERSTESGKARGRFYRTGDKGRWNAQGQLEFIGRFDRQVKLRGFRIELGECEAALMRTPGVKAAAVLLRSSEPKALVAFVEPATIDPAAARSQCRLLLPTYMVPARVEGLAAMPRLPNGKTNLRALQAQAEELLFTTADATASTGPKGAAGGSAARSTASTLDTFLKSADAGALVEEGVDSMGLLRLFNKAFEVRAVQSNLRPRDSTDVRLPRRQAGGQVTRLRSSTLNSRSRILSQIFSQISDPLPDPGSSPRSSPRSRIPS